MIATVIVRIHALEIEQKIGTSSQFTWIVSHIYDTVPSLRVQNIPYQGFVSSEWYWENIFSFSFAASQIVSGQKCDECLSNESKMGVAA